LNKDRHVSGVRRTEREIVPTAQFGFRDDAANPPAEADLREDRLDGWFVSVLPDNHDLLGGNALDDGPRIRPLRSRTPRRASGSEYNTTFVED